MTLYDTTYDSNFCDTRNLYQNLKIWYFGIFRRKDFFLQIFRNTFTLEPIYFINSKPDLAFKFRCCEFGFIKQIRKLNNITLYHGIKREGKFKIIVFEPQTRYLLEISKCHEKNRRKNPKKVWRKDINLSQM